MSTVKNARNHYRIRDALSKIEDQLADLDDIPRDFETQKAIGEIEEKIETAKHIITRNYGDENYVDPENIYNLPGVRQSIEEDRKR